MENQSHNRELYTLGIWTVIPGKEAEFIREWTAFSSWTSKSTPGNGRAYLLRDEKDSSRFISFGPWDNQNSIRKWRESEEFKNFVQKVKTLCEDFQPNTLKVAATTE